VSSKYPPSELPPNLTRQEYIRDLLASYRRTPGTCGRTRASDHTLAGQLYDRHIPLQVAETALLLATARRLLNRPADAPQLATVRSLNYYMPVVDELVANPPDPAYIHYLRRRLSQPL